MRRFGSFLYLLTLMGCSDDAAEPPPRSLLLPSAPVLLAPGGGGTLPGAFGYGTPPRQAGCRTRYEFAGDAAPVDCTTELIGGDPFHWLRRCPDHPGLELENEVVVDATGRLLSSRVLWRRSVDSLRTDTNQFSYDSAGRLAGIVSGPNDDQPTGRTLTVLEYSPGGQPSRMISSGSIVRVNDEIFIPGSDEAEIDVTYDEHDRVIARTIRNTGDGARDGSFWDEVIAYDDSDGRIDREVDIAVSYNVSTQPQTGVNAGYQLFDDRNHVIADHYQNPGEPPFDFTFSYDDDGQLLTTTFDNHKAGVEREEYIAHEIRVCP